MEQKRDPMIAACGIDCGTCDIRLVTTDAGAAERIVAWFRRAGWLKENEGVAEIVQRAMHCNGCRGDMSVQWSSDCTIRSCCVQEKGLQLCSECPSFPCARLDEWARDDAGHQEALERLRALG